MSDAFTLEPPHSGMLEGGEDSICGDWEAGHAFTRYLTG
jgi:hypothetical protein